MKYGIFGSSLWLLGSLSFTGQVPQREVEVDSESTKLVGPDAVNWDAPSKRELVARALSDGMTDPKQIVAWAKQYKVRMTLKDVRKIKAELNKKPVE